MRLLIIIFSLLLSSCSTFIPKHDLVLLNNMNQVSAAFEINQYNDSLIQKAQIISTTIFNFKGRKMTALGATEIDEKQQTYKVAALNPMGLTLFQIKVANNIIVSSYVIPQFGENNADKAAEMISKDIAYIYFNRNVDVKKNSINLDKYKATTNVKIDNDSHYKYIFSGKPLKLTTKSKYENNKKTWSVNYYDYQKTGNGEMPFRIIFQNHKYGYMLETVTKKINSF
ncbi:MAG: DUF3261 domain-containing protein [Desulfobacterales bacterium]|nr:DUF3261 domain-containing protein [Desulfobacterales bacterium]